MIEIKYQYIELITSVIKQLMKDKKKITYGMEFDNKNERDIK